MTLDQIEELIRKYLAMGVTVIVILTGPQNGGAAGSSSRSSAPSIVTVEPSSSADGGTGSPTTTASPTPTGSPDTTNSPDTTGADGTDPGSGDNGGSGTSGTNDSTATADPQRRAGTGTAGQSTGGSGAGSAASALGWGAANRSEDFTSGTGSWRLYDGAGHNGRGRRSPSAASVANGVLTITGSPDGTTEGMAWNPGQKYGRWEARVRTPAGDPSYHAVLLLWPDAENWPEGGEVDFMEISDPSRQSVDMFLHYGSNNSQKSGKVQIDATQWHDWAVEWTPQGITSYVDGKQWWKTTDTSILPPGPMHMTIQLDWFPGGGSSKGSSMQVDWVRQYPAVGG